jgi:predicted Rossmann fold nucleotide-binding protein DprA/Smf involved in DNA uptake
MNIGDYLSDDGQAMLLLCSQLGGEDKPDAPAPFKLSEWNQLAKKIQASRLQCPAGMFGQDGVALAAALEVPESEGERIAQLLARSGQVAILLENLFGRGIWAVTRMDPLYPAKLRDTLKHQAPTVLFGAGDIYLLKQSGIAVIGSRTLDQAGIDFARQVGHKTAAAKLPVVSGGARGTDRLAMDGALQAGGKAIGVMADSLERTIRQPDVRQFLLDGSLVLLTPYAPDAGFSIGAAMGRNKVIYGLASHAVVVSSDLEKGGTWAGAVEALKAGWCPVFVRVAKEMSKGNGALLKQGALAFDEQQLTTVEDLPAWLQVNGAQKTVAQELFTFALSDRQKRS